jgi:hypothetical protein
MNIPYTNPSDDAQLISIRDVDYHVQTCNIQNISKITKYSLAEFNNNLSFVIWDDTFDHNDVCSMFNSSLNTFYNILF